MLDKVTEGVSDITTLHYVIEGINTTGISWIVTTSLVTTIGGCFYMYKFITTILTSQREVSSKVDDVSSTLEKINNRLSSQQTEILDRQSRSIVRLDKLEEKLNTLKRKK